MEVAVNARYGAVLVSESNAHYVPTTTPPWQAKTPAATDSGPEIARQRVIEIEAEEGAHVRVGPTDLLRVDGVVTFSGDGSTAEARACNWAQIEELAGPLRYREDVADAAMYTIPGECRPRVPIRVARHGLGAVAVYLSAHGHGPLATKRALGLTYSQQERSIYEDVYRETPSFEWGGLDYE